MEKLWKDPVWSKIISAIILSVGAFFISLIYSLLTNLTIKESFDFLWNYKISLGPSIITLIVIFSIISVIKSIRKKSPTKSKILEEAFHKKHNKFVDTENKITYRYNAYINSYTKFPFISELRVYCNMHDVETLMKPNGGCNRPNCKHYNQGYSERDLKQEIETFLLLDWEEMKK